MLTKRCSSCGVVKQIEAFGGTSQQKDGRRVACRPCGREYARNYYQRRKQEYQALARKYRVKHKEKISAARKAAYRRYMNSLTKEQHAENCAKKREYAKKYYALDPQKHRDRARSVRLRNPTHELARKAVKYAIFLGILSRKPCSECQSTERIHAHHHKGYERANWLDVIWLCSICHGRVHREEV